MTQSNNSDMYYQHEPKTTGNNLTLQTYPSCSQEILTIICCKTAWGELNHIGSGLVEPHRKWG